MSKIEIDSSTLKKLANLLNKENLAEIEVGQKDNYIKITRTPSGIMSAAPAPVAAPITPTHVATETDAKPTSPKIQGHTVNSPIVGTVYLASQPGNPPFTEIGKSVKKGETLLIIEAMKVMNQIEADKDGVVKEILVADSQAVEFGQPLVVID